MPLSLNYKNVKWDCEYELYNLSKKNFGKKAKNNKQKIIH